MRRRTALLLLVACSTAGPVATPAAGQIAGVSARASRLEAQLSYRPGDQTLYVALAAEYEARGHRDRAEATLRAGLTQAQDPRPVRANLVELLARSERWAEALEVAEPLTRDSGGRAAVARLRVNAGLAAYNTGRRAEARVEWERAVQADPTLVEAAVNLGALLLEIGARDSARAVASRALTFHPDHPRLLTLRAAAVEGPDALPAAVTALRRLRALQPDNEQVGLELASLLAAKGDRLSAFALYDTLLRAPAPSEAAYQAAATLWLETSQLNGTVALIEKGLERFPRSGTLMALLGEAEAAGKEWRKSAAAFRRAAQRLPRPEDAELPLLDVLVEAGNTAEAVALIQELASRPALRDVLHQIAPRVVMLGRPAVADSIYRDLLGRDSLDIVALEAAAALAETTPDTARAVALYRLAMSRDSAGPVAPFALLRLTATAPDSARLLLRRGVWRGMDALQALELQNAAATSGPVSPRALARARPSLDRQRRVRDLLRAGLDTIVLRTTWGPDELKQLRLAYPQSALLERYAATLEAREGSSDTALARYDRLLQRDATDAESQRARAQVLERMGRTRDAITGYTRAFDLTPEDEPAFRALQRLRQADGSLAELLQQIRRLRVRLPASRTLGDHEIEVLQRLGRMSEAQDVAKRLKETNP